MAACLWQELNHLVSIHCSAHQVALRVVRAIKTHPKMEEMQVMLKNLYDQYHYSPEAIRKLLVNAEALEGKAVKPYNPSWHLLAALCALCNQG